MTLEYFCRRLLVVDSNKFLLKKSVTESHCNKPSNFKNSPNHKTFQLSALFPERGIETGMKRDGK